VRYAKKYLVFFIYFFGCAMPGQMRELALKRTTFDFDCPYDQLSVVKIF
jgi:hypothetical protein